MYNQVLLSDLAREHQNEYDYPIVLATVDGKLRELNNMVERDSRIEFITTKSNIGIQTYRRSVVLMMLSAIYDVASEEMVPPKVKVLYSISKGYYCEIDAEFEVDEDFLNRVSARMKEVVKLDLPINKKSLAVDEGRELFAKLGMPDKEKLFKYRLSSKVNLYDTNGYEDYYYGYMVPSTGYLKYFELHKYDKGFVLQLPTQHAPKQVPEFNPPRKLFETLKRSSEWGEMLGVDTVGALNDAISAGEIQELILVQEAIQEKQIADIAEQIVSSKNKKFIMIAGPSSSGKTTFSHRLSIQLRAHGLKPHPIAVDDYFVEREQTPVDENGNYNFESLYAVDIELFNRHMKMLLNGERVEIPTFNFKTGKKEYKGNFKQLGPDDILVIEGIHCLNDKLSYSLPRESKFKIYISALTQLNIDEHNRIPTTDGRLIRRMVRDARTRGANAERTISMWDSVRRGEEENIFPFQEEADAMFNSALIYELAVLKQYAEPLLFSVPRDSEHYVEAKRLLKFLDYFLGVNSEDIPNNSILREFLGGSCFKI